MYLPDILLLDLQRSYDILLIRFNFSIFTFLHYIFVIFALISLYCFRLYLQ